MSEKSLRAKAIPGLRLRLRGSPAFAETTGDGPGVENRDKIDAKRGNWAYNANCLGTQNGNP